MRNSDRGSLKWTSLMIPEHKEMMQGLYAELDQVEKPELDEQEKERINESLAVAMEYGKIIHLSTYSDGETNERIKVQELTLEEIVLTNRLSSFVPISSAFQLEE